MTVKPDVDWWLQTALVSPTEEEYDQLLQRLQIRIDENQGETIFIVGVGGKTLNVDLGTPYAVSSEIIPLFVQHSRLCLTRFNI